MSRLNTFYGKKGEKGMSLLVFVTFFVIYSALGMFLQVISLEEEFAGASAAAGFLGRDWTEMMPAVNSIGGSLRGIPYIPAMLCPDPIVQYKLIMLINSALYALIPFVAFRLTAKLGVEKLGKRLLVTLICGIYPSVLTYSHYMLSESLAAVFVWLLLLVIFREEKENGKKASAFFASVTAGLLTACAYYLNNSCIGVFVAVGVFAVYARLVHKKKPLYLSIYAITFLLLISADIVLTYFARDIYAFSGGIVQTVINSADALANGAAEFFALLGGRLFYFIASCWGIGGAAVTFAVIAVVSFIRCKRRNEEQYYDSRFVLMGVLMVLMLIFTLPADAFLSLSKGVGLQDNILGAQGVFTFAVPLVMLFFSYLFVYGISYTRLLLSVTSNGVAATAAMLAYNKSFNDAGILSNVITPGMTAMLIGCDASAGLTSSVLLYPVCLMFTVFAVIVPVVCCTKLHASSITAAVFSGVIIYASVFAATTGIFGYARQTGENAADTLRINNCIAQYSGGTDNKIIAVYDSDRMIAMSIQYYNQSSTVKYIEKGEELPTDCYVVSGDSISVNGACVLIGRINDINVYAIGENASRYTGEEPPFVQPGTPESV